MLWFYLYISMLFLWSCDGPEKPTVFDPLTQLPLPQTIITEGPQEGDTLTTSADSLSIIFTWTSNHGFVEQFRYRINEGSWSEWSSNDSVSFKVGLGNHTFEVAGRIPPVGDKPGLEDSTPAIRHFMIGPTEVNQLVAVGGIDWDGLNFWITAQYGDKWKLYKVSADANSIERSVQIPYDPSFQALSAVAYYDGKVYARLHPTNRIDSTTQVYEYNIATGRLLGSSYTSRKWSIDMTFVGSELWQANDDTEFNPDRFEIYDQSGHEFPGPTKGRKSITSDGTFLYVGDWGNRRVWKVQVPDGIVIQEYKVTAPLDSVPLRMAYRDGTLWSVAPEPRLVQLELEPVNPGVSFTDPNLEAAIRGAVSKPTGDILKSEIDTLTYLDASSRSIASLGGFEQLTSLKTLIIYGNQIGDISPLTNLTELSSIDLGSNKIRDLSPLSNLISLRELVVYDNEISDITPISNLTSLTALSLPNNQIRNIDGLSNLTSLKRLELGSNQINDISALSGLTSLEVLHLDYNQISDISPLENLVSLMELKLALNEVTDVSALVSNIGIDSGDSVTLTGNPLGIMAISTDIPALRRRGMVVLFVEIAFATNRDGNNEIYTMNSDGTGVDRLTDDGEDDGSPSWLPNRSEITFKRGTGGSEDIYIMDAYYGFNVVPLIASSSVDMLPSWSPDGSKATFMSKRDGNEELYVANADGSGVIRLTNTAESEWTTDWSPDGTRVAFDTKRNGNWDVYVMDGDGSNQIQLTTSMADELSPSWSPDGSQIAFTSNQSGNNEIYLMNVDGSNWVNLTNNLADDYDPAWSPDGSQIAFVSERDGNPEIYAMDADGSNPVNLTNDLADDIAPDWLSVPQLFPPPTGDIIIEAPIPEE